MSRSPSAQTDTLMEDGQTTPTSRRLTGKYRRNGKLQSCEPCRKSKLKCDHVVPVCGRCVKRRCADKCVYHPHPLTVSFIPCPVYMLPVCDSHHVFSLWPRQETGLLYIKELPEGICEKANESLSVDKRLHLIPSPPGLSFMTMRPQTHLFTQSSPLLRPTFSMLVLRLRLFKLPKPPGKFSEQPRLRHSMSFNVNRQFVRTLALLE